MSLPTAYYFMMGSHRDYQYSIGRSPFEDHSLNPKPVWLLRPSAEGFTPWLLTKTARGYVFTVKDTPTGAEGNSVVAILDNNRTPVVEWIVEPVPNEQDRFRIRNTNRQYWTVDGSNTQNGYKIVLRREGEGSQIFNIFRAYRDFSNEEEKYSQRTDSKDGSTYNPEKSEESGRQNFFGSGKREKKFCS
ncbi:hypothetical protein AOL_s00054g904 [Orbilia oligospora ATCC 24927]|uniref:Ricin B lectin domain-containing protein n=1 Tax=Arthrobotrys oligospora (strain ATCC 24927 / CBS 115.81 / DSM 1491) TaxID=756982 RepID=G1X7I7_ARTOA|nr:hypothetical protein AOL_s00054g904 [Orbilia oligospora ATCC 24927]EGX50818.1 hypothetical protein AOL_s00054g904 [Orbilia oligospora ATCC 24927]